MPIRFRRRSAVPAPRSTTHSFALAFLSTSLVLAGFACGHGATVQVGAPPGAARTPPTFPGVEARPTGPVPDSSGWGTHVLAVEQAPDGSVWVGTYGQGIYVARDIGGDLDGDLDRDVGHDVSRDVDRDGSGTTWENIRAGDSASISWDFVNAIAFAPGEVWYGTVGNGWGVSRDGGRTWRNWTFDQFGPRWQYVAPGGIATAGDTVYVATADGLRITPDHGETYRDVTDRTGLPNKYLLGLEVRPVEGAAPAIRVLHLRGVSESDDGGRTWRTAGATSGPEAGSRAPADPEESKRTGVAEESGIAPEERRVALEAGTAPESSGSTDKDGAAGQLVRRIREWSDVFRTYPAPDRRAARPGKLEHFWFRRPISPEDNPYLDQTYTYGSTMGGNFQQHQGVELNNPEGTDVHAIGDGVVRFAGEGEAGANTVAIHHDRRWEKACVWSIYYHNADLVVESGDRVRAGDVIAHVGATGRATNDHLHVEIRTLPPAACARPIDVLSRFPPFTRNPQLWIEPLPGTGAIAGTVFDSRGERVPGARVYGVTKQLPRETPFSFAETYEDKAYSDPAFREHFAIGDVPAGEYVLGVEVEGRRLFRSVRVEPGKVTQVEFRP